MNLGNEQRRIVAYLDGLRAKVYVLREWWSSVGLSLSKASPAFVAGRIETQSALMTGIP